MTENVYAEMKGELGQQLSLERIDAALRRAREACHRSEYPVGLFVVSEILETLERYWRERGTISADTEIVLSETLMPPVRRYLDARGRARLDATKEIAYLDEMVKAFLRWSASQQGAMHGS